MSSTAILWIAYAVGYVGWLVYSIGWFFKKDDIKVQAFLALVWPLCVIGLLLYWLFGRPAGPETRSGR
jgi:hypothetical protein